MNPYKFHHIRSRWQRRNTRTGGKNRRSRTTRHCWCKRWTGKMSVVDTTEES